MTLSRDRRGRTLLECLKSFKDRPLCQGSSEALADRAFCVSKFRKQSKCSHRKKPAELPLLKENTARKALRVIQKSHASIAGDEACACSKVHVHIPEIGRLQNAAGKEREITWTDNISVGRSQNEASPSGRSGAVGKLLGCVSVFKGSVPCVHTC
jgi:hypothetical protein